MFGNEVAFQICNVKMIRKIKPPGQLKYCIKYIMTKGVAKSVKAVPEYKRFAP